MAQEPVAEAEESIEGPEERLLGHSYSPQAICWGIRLRNAPGL